MLDKRLEKISVHFLIFLLLLGAVKVQVHNVEIRTFGTVHGPFLVAYHTATP